MADRLQEIKRALKYWPADDTAWLIAEVERLRAALDAVLRTHVPESERAVAARRVAVDLLGGYEAWNASHIAAAASTGDTQP